MSTGTGIEWTEATWNPITGCTRVSAGCDHCYAATMTHRLEGMGKEKYAGLTVLNRAGDRHFNGKIQLHDDALLIPLKWRKARRVFVNSMSDLFHRDVPFDFIDKVFAVMALCPQHKFQILTKRPERMAEYLSPIMGVWSMDRLEAAARSVGHTFFFGDGPSRRWVGRMMPFKNVWLGSSCENQQTANERIPHLLRCPAAVRFLSCEPLLGPIDLRSVPNTSDPMPGCPNGAPSRRIDWVIVGGESGKGARPCNVDWIRSLVEQCQAAGVPCFVKQLGGNVRWSGVQGGYGDGVSNIWPDGTLEIDVNYGWRMQLKSHKGGDINEWPEDLRVRQFPQTASDCA